MRVNYRASREQKKAIRARQVERIVVEVVRADGTILRFDGDEESQQRLDRYGRRASANGYATIPWVMANNTSAEVTPEEMEQALDAAMQAQGELWFIA